MYILYFTAFASMHSAESFTKMRTYKASGISFESYFKDDLCSPATITIEKALFHSFLTQNSFPAYSPQDRFEAKQNMIKTGSDFSSCPARKQPSKPLSIQTYIME